MPKHTNSVSVILKTNNMRLHNDKTRNDLELSPHLIHLTQEDAETYIFYSDAITNLVLGYKPSSAAPSGQGKHKFEWVMDEIIEKLVHAEGVTGRVQGDQGKHKFEWVMDEIIEKLVHVEGVTGRVQGDQGITAPKNISNTFELEVKPIPASSSPTKSPDDYTKVAGQDFDEVWKPFEKSDEKGTKKILACIIELIKSLKQAVAENPGETDKVIKGIVEEFNKKQQKDNSKTIPDLTDDLAAINLSTEDAIGLRKAITDKQQNLREAYVKVVANRKLNEAKAAEKNQQRSQPNKSNIPVPKLLILEIKEQGQVQFRLKAAK